MLLLSTDSVFIRLSDLGDWDIAFIVSVLALFVHLILNRIFGKASPVESFRAYPGPLLLVAFNAAVSQVTFIAAINRTEIANVVIVIGSAPMLAALAGWLLLKENPDRRTWVAIGLTMIGILVVVSGSIGRPNLAGDMLALVAVGVFSINFTIWRRYPDMSRFVGLGLSAIMILVVSAPLVTPLAHDATSYLPLLLMGLVFSPIGRICHSNAPRFAPTAEVALFVPIETVAATMWAWIVFSEVPTARTFFGGAVVIAAVLWGTFVRLMLTRRGSIVS